MAQSTKDGAREAGHRFGDIRIRHIAEIESLLEAGEYVDSAKLAEVLRQHGTQPLPDRVLDYLCRYLEGDVKKTEGIRAGGPIRSVTVCDDPGGRISAAPRMAQESKETIRPFEGVGSASRRGLLGRPAARDRGAHGGASLALWRPLLADGAERRFFTALTLNCCE